MTTKQMFHDIRGNVLVASVSDGDELSGIKPRDVYAILEYMKQLEELLDNDVDDWKSSIEWGSDDTQA